MLYGLPVAARHGWSGSGDRAGAVVDVRSPATAIPFIALHAPRSDEERARYERAAIAATGLAFEALAPRSSITRCTTAAPSR